MLAFINTLDRKRGKRIETVSNGEVYPVFYALLFTAGLSLEVTTRNALYAFMNFGRTVALRSFKNGIDHNKALELLSNATARPDKKHFYSTLADCVPVDTQFSFVPSSSFDERQHKMYQMRQAQMRLVAGKRSLTIP